MYYLLRRPRIISCAFGCGARSGAVGTLRRASSSRPCPVTRFLDICNRVSWLFFEGLRSTSLSRTRLWKPRFADLCFRFDTLMLYHTAFHARLLWQSRYDSPSLCGGHKRNFCAFMGVLLYVHMCGPRPRSTLAVEKVFPQLASQPRNHKSNRAQQCVVRTQYNSNGTKAAALDALATVTVAFFFCVWCSAGDQITTNSQFYAKIKCAPSNLIRHTQRTRYNSSYVETDPCSPASTCDTPGITCQPHFQGGAPTCSVCYYLITHFVMYAAHAYIYIVKWLELFRGFADVSYPRGGPRREEKGSDTLQMMLTRASIDVLHARNSEHRAIQRLKANLRR